MRYAFVVSAFIVLSCAMTARADEHTMMDHPMHLAALSDDNRQAVDFPPEMRKHILANMRDHLQALSDILSAMSAGEYSKSAQIANARLGLESSAAQVCKVDDSASASKMPPPMGMEQMMRQFMPDGMRKAGLAMHQSASDFAAEAAKAEKSGDAKTAYAALARVTRQCTSCHGAFKLQQ